MKIINKSMAVVIRDNGFFLVRKHDKDIWTGLGGHPEPGESEEQALLREIEEEAHCKAKIVRKLGDFEAPAAFDDAIVCLATYLVELDGDPKIDDPELAEGKFIDKNYKEQGIKLPVSIEQQIIPFCIKEGLLRW